MKKNWTRFNFDPFFAIQRYECLKIGMSFCVFLVYMFACAPISVKSVLMTGAKC